MYNLKPLDDLAINSTLLLDSDKETLEKVFIEDGVDSESLENMMTLIHDWYQKEPHLPKGQLHDQMIVRMLIMRKYSIEQVKQKIDNYYSARVKMPEFLTNRDPMEPNLNKCMKAGYWVILPRKTPDNTTITIFRMSSVENIYVVDLMKVIFMIDDFKIRNDSASGEHFIVDCSNVTLQLIVQLTPVVVSKVVYYVLECLGPKMKGIHIINLPAFAEIIVTLVKKVMKPKLVQRMRFYKSFDEVLKNFPANIFPKDLGGSDNVTCQEITDAWAQTLCSASWRKFFLEQDSVHTDESKRIYLKNCQVNFGVDGSFKKLSID